MVLRMQLFAAPRHKLIHDSCEWFFVSHFNQDTAEVRRCSDSVCMIEEMDEEEEEEEKNTSEA